MDDSWKESFRCSIEKLTDWNVARTVARRTVNKPDLPEDREVSSGFKQKMLISEHSPIRTVTYLIYLENVPTWVSQHIARHDKFAGHCMRDGDADEHFVGTQRSDRVGEERGDQWKPCNHTIYLNAQDFITISKLRLCSKASSETRWVWKEILKELFKLEPEMTQLCVPQCIYRGVCPEPGGCNLLDSSKGQSQRQEYVSYIKKSLS